MYYFPSLKQLPEKNKTKNMRMLQQNFPLPVIDLFLCNRQERNRKRVSQRLRQTLGPNNQDKLKNPPGKCSISRRSLPGRHIWVTSYFAQSLDNYSWLPIIRTFRKLEVIHFFSLQVIFPICLPSITRTPVNSSLFSFPLKAWVIGSQLHLKIHLWLL